MRRVADDGLWSEQSAHHADGKVVLPYVYASRSRHQREIEPIVDHDERAIPAGGRNDVVTQLDESIGRESLRPELNALRAAIQKGTREIRGLPPGALRDVDVDDGVKRR